MVSTDSETQTGQAARPAEGLFIDDGGTGGTPVLFVHSAAGSTEHFAAQLAHLRKKRRAVALDLRGHGRSAPPPDGDYTIAALAADVVAVADRLGLERFVLVGHSLGGAVAAEVVGRNPERVAGLVLLDPASDARGLPEAEKQGLLAAVESGDWRSTVEAYWGSMLGGSSESVREFLLQGLRATRKDAVVEPLKALLFHDAITPLSRYSGPKLSLITALNEIPTAYHAQDPGLRHRKIEGTGHWLALDDPKAVNRAIDDFLAEARL